MHREALPARGARFTVHGQRITVHGLFRSRIMNTLVSNIWNHPRTSAAGLLIAIVSIGGVLSQQGISLGHAGTGTVVTLVTAIASALLGLLARDPASTAPNQAR